MIRALKAAFGISILCLLLVLASLPALATAPKVTCAVVPGEEDTEFIYTITNMDFVGFLNGFHLYAPIAPNYLGIKPSLWTNDLTPDGYGGSYIHWYAPSQKENLFWGDSIVLHVFISVPIEVVNNYTWGQSNTNWAFNFYLDQTTHPGSGSVPVPLAVPEPCGLVAITFGFALLIRRLVLSTQC